MNEVQFSNGIAMLRGAYPQSRAELTDQNTLDVWFEMLHDIDGDKFFDGLKRIILKNKFLPSISEIRGAVLGTSEEEIETKALLAWNTVIKGIRDAGYIRSVKFSDPIIHNTIQSLGGWIRLCTLPDETELKFFRIAFLKAYRGFRTAYLEGIMPEISHLVGKNEIENLSEFPELIEPPKEIGFNLENLPAKKGGA